MRRDFEQTKLRLQLILIPRAATGCCRQRGNRSARRRRESTLAGRSRGAY